MKEYEKPIARIINFSSEEVLDDVVTPGEGPSGVGGDTGTNPFG